jgi:hypothetical protein
MTTGCRRDQEGLRKVTFYKSPLENRKGGPACVTFRAFWHGSMAKSYARCGCHVDLHQYICRQISWSRRQLRNRLSGTAALPFYHSWCRLRRVGRGCKMNPRVANTRRSAFEFIEGFERHSTTGAILDAMEALLKRHGCRWRSRPQHQQGT